MYRALKPHALSASLAQFDVISHSHAYMSISHALALCWKVTLENVLAVRSAYNYCKISSTEGVHVPGFNKLVHFQ